MDNQLYHHGVKGMKWGVRRYQNKDGSRTLAGKKRRNELENAHEDYKRVHDSKSVRQMSDKELRERNNRLQMERQYESMTKKKSKGKQFIDAFVATATTVAAISGAIATYKKVGGPIVNKIIEKVGKKAI